MTPSTDSPDADAPDDAENATDYPYSLCHRKKKKNIMTPNTDAPKNDASDAADDDAASLDSLILDLSLKRKIDPKSMLKLKKLKGQ